MCLYPKLIKNRKYLANKKNGGNVPPVLDERVKYVPVGCGKCIECSKQKARSWQIRLLEEVKRNTNGKFITLTFSNESIAKLCTQIKNKEAKAYDLDNEIATRAMRLFNERWRKKFKKALRHWMVTELGHEGTENVHLHGILWTSESFETIRNIWDYGFIWPRKEEEKYNYVTQRTVNYIIKYVNKIDKDHKYYKPVILTSPGIGAEYTKSINFKKHQYNDTQTIDTYRTTTGHKIALPIYYRNKAFNEEQREKLWIQKLDKNERWVCGEKVKADDLDSYNKIVAWHRERNKKLGYGNDEIDWNREQYEKERRKILQEKRIQDAKRKNDIQAPKHNKRTTRNNQRPRNKTNATKK